MIIISSITRDPSHQTHLYNYCLHSSLPFSPHPSDLHILYQPHAFYSPPTKTPLRRPTHLLHPILHPTPLLHTRCARQTTESPPRVTSLCAGRPGADLERRGRTRLSPLGRPSPGRPHCPRLGHPARILNHNLCTRLCRTRHPPRNPRHNRGRPRKPSLCRISSLAPHRKEVLLLLLFLLLLVPLPVLVLVPVLFYPPLPFALFPPLARLSTLPVDTRNVPYPRCVCFILPCSQLLFQRPPSAAFRRRRTRGW